LEILQRHPDRRADQRSNRQAGAASAAMIIIFHGNQNTSPAFRIDEPYIMAYTRTPATLVSPAAS